MRTEQENKEIAELLFPEVLETVEDIFKKFPKRQLNENELVTRFAPSPTGFLHVGTVFTSLINRKLVDQNGGVCILRIEDTDKKREVEGGVKLTLDGLKEFGIEFDESIERGDYGPYIQSERLDIYKVFAKNMVAKGNAYPCFINEDELEEIRKKQNELGVRTGYYGEWAKWRNSSIEDIKRELDAKKNFAIRLYSTGNFEEKFEFDDLIKGRASFSFNDIDVVLLKSDGYPTYHFAHPIDDVLMGVNLVVRTNEWFPSVPIHLELFDKLGFERIRYAHASPLMKLENGSKRKLSKRKDPEADTRYFLENGYPTVAILEYFLNIMNSGFADWRLQNPKLPYTDFELKLGKFNKSGALFDMVKLEDTCKEYVSKLSAEEVYDFVKIWAEKYDKQLFTRLSENKGYTVSIFNIEREGKKIRKDIVKWADVLTQLEIFFDDMYVELKKDHVEMEKNLQKDILQDFVNTLYFDDNREEWFEKIKNIAVGRGFCTDYKEFENNPEKYYGKVGDVAMVIRVAITGKKQTPDLYEIIQVLGEGRVVRRINEYMKQL